MMDDIKEETLKNGIKLFLINKQSRYCSIQVTVKVGPRNEDDHTRGISHFIEHMLFEGTKNRDSFEIARQIEGIGGEIGAFTSSERTGYYVNCLNRYADKAAEILSDIIINPLFEENMLEKERKVVLSEISIGEDDPRRHQWSVFLNKLYTNHPLQHPIIGYEDVLKKMVREDLQQFHTKHYVAENMIITVVGGIESLDSVKKYFGVMDKKEAVKNEIIEEPLTPKLNIFKEKRDISQSYMVIGAKTVPRKEKESYALEVIRSILGKGLSGRLFFEIRTKRGLGYDIGIHNENLSDTGFFSFYVSTKKKNIELCEEIFKDQLKKLDNLEKSEIEEAKNFIEGEFIIDNEDNNSMADSIGEWEMLSGVKDFYGYIKKIREVSKKDILDARNRYLTKNFSRISIEENK